MVSLVSSNFHSYVHQVNSSTKSLITWTLFDVVPFFTDFKTNYEHCNKHIYVDTDNFVIQEYNL